MNETPATGAARPPGATKAKLRSAEKLRAPERNTPAWLRRDAERISGALPPLVAEARRIASSVSGVHGRRRSGPGETFWQYRQAMPGDPATAVDWRRSARSDQLYIREMEWEAAQTVSLWSDTARAMDYRSDIAPRSKRDRASLLTLALGVLLMRGGERVALLGTDAGLARSGETQLQRMAAALARRDESAQDYGAPPPATMARGGKAVFMSDFLGPLEPIRAAVAAAADQGVAGALLQIVDPAEEAFPFDGRLILRSMSGAVEHETHRARTLKDAYRARLAERRDALQEIARKSGWRFDIHRTDESPRRPLLWLYGALAGG